jgi:hypothetical protein
MSDYTFTDDVQARTPDRIAQECAEAIARALMTLQPGQHLKVECHDPSDGDGRLWTVSYTEPATL